MVFSLSALPEWTDAGGGNFQCGAATHPAGSVIALNCRNAAEAVLADAVIPVV